MASCFISNYHQWSNLCSTVSWYLYVTS